MSAVNIYREAVNEFDHGSKGSIGVSALPLTAVGFGAAKGIELIAAATNAAGIVYVGNADVTAGSAEATDGFPLAAGARLFIPIERVSSIHLIGSTTGLKVFWIAY